jgi:hypothetical protein
LRDETAELLLHERVAHDERRQLRRAAAAAVRREVRQGRRPGKQLWRRRPCRAGHRIAGLPSQLADEDEEAKRFDMLVLRTQLSILQAKPDFAEPAQKIQAIASALEDQWRSRRSRPRSC